LEGQRKTIINMKNPFCWDITPCSPLKVEKPFGGTCSDGLRGWNAQGSNLGRGKKYFSDPQLLDQLWDLHSLISNGYREVLPLG
jgi:hypothetical protein